MNTFKIPQVGFFSEDVFVFLIVFSVLGADTFPALRFEGPVRHCIRRGFHTTLVAEKENVPFFLALFKGIRVVARATKELLREQGYGQLSVCGVCPKNAGLLVKAHIHIFHAYSGRFGGSSVCAGLSRNEKRQSGNAPWSFPESRRGISRKPAGIFQ